MHLNDFHNNVSIIIIGGLTFKIKNKFKGGCFHFSTSRRKKKKTHTHTERERERERERAIKIINK